VHQRLSGVEHNEENRTTRRAMVRAQIMRGRGLIVRVKFIVVAAALSLAAGCSTESKCGAENCPGCCNGDTCETGTANLACGFGGAACVTCTGITTCTSAQVCGNPVCRTLSCSDYGRSCGDVSDGCGGVLHCGTCTGSRTCSPYKDTTGKEAWQCGLACTPACLSGMTCGPEGVCLGDLSKLVFDEEVQTVSGKLKINGTDAVKNSANCSASANPTAVIATIWWKDSTQKITGSQQLLCKDPDLSFKLALAIGTYEIGIEPGPGAELAGLQLPYGGWKFPGSPLVVPKLASQLKDPSAYFNVTGFALVQGRLRIDGAAPVQNPFCIDTANASAVVAIAELTSRSTGNVAVANITCGSNFNFSQRVAEGRYDIRIRPGPAMAQAGLNLPNTAVLMRQDAALSTLTGVGTYDVRTLTVSGRITIAGAAPNLGSYCNPPARPNDELARVRFVEPTKGYELSTTVLCDPNLAWQIRLPEGGTWNAYVSPGSEAQLAGLGLLPMQVQSLTAQPVTAPLTGVMLDQRGRSVTGTLTLRGQAPQKGTNFCTLGPTSDLAVLRFQDTQKAQETELVFRCDSPNWSYSLQLPEGAWVVSLERASTPDPLATNLPEGKYTFPFTVNVTGASTVADLNADDQDVGVQVRVNGKIPELPLTCASQPGTVFAQIELTQTATGMTAVRALDCSHSTWKVTTPLAPGEWKVRVRADDPNAPLGGLLSGWVSVPAFTVPVATGTVLVDEKPLSISGTIQVNGKQPQRADTSKACGFTGPAAFLHVKSQSGSYEGTARIQCTSGQEPSWTVTVPLQGPEKYDVALEGSALAPPFNVLLERVPVATALEVK
jgi:hypothetical protein